jgi:hypothetical protein
MPHIGPAGNKHVAGKGADHHDQQDENKLDELEKERLPSKEDFKPGQLTIPDSCHHPSGERIGCLEPLHTLEKPMVSEKFIQLLLASLANLNVLKEVISILTFKLVINERRE